MVESKIQMDALLLPGVRKFLQNSAKFGGNKAANVPLIRRQFVASRPRQRRHAPASIQ
jgi:hypothetical protein